MLKTGIRAGFEPFRAAGFALDVSHKDDAFSDDPVFLSEANPTVRLKTGADKLQKNQRPRRAEFFALPIMGPPRRVAASALSPYRPFAHSSTRRFAP